MNVLLHKLLCKMGIHRMSQRFVTVFDSSNKQRTDIVVECDYCGIAGKHNH